MPCLAAKLWFLDGKNSEGKVVSNPNIGYGSHTMTYADGSSREFYQIGISANTSGVSVYVMGLDDKNYLADTFGTELGKASVSGYCIKFKALEDIDVDVLEKAIRAGVAATKLAAQRLLEIGDQVVDVLDADREPEQVGRCRRAGALGAARCSMRLSTPPSEVARFHSFVFAATAIAACSPPATRIDSIPPNPPGI